MLNIVILKYFRIYFLISSLLLSLSYFLIIQFFNRKKVKLSILFYLKFFKKILNIFTFESKYYLHNILLKRFFYFLFKKLLWYKFYFEKFIYIENGSEKKSYINLNKHLKKKNKKNKILINKRYYYCSHKIDMKIVKFFRKTNVKTHTKFNRNYARQQQFDKDFYQNINKIVNNNINESYDLRQNLINDLKKIKRHPTIVDILDDDGNSITISITNLTTKNNLIYLNGKSIEVEYLGNFNGRNQYWVKKIIKIKISKEQLKEGKILSNNNNFNFNERDNEKMTEVIKDKLNSGKKVTVVEIEQNKLNIGQNDNYSLNNFESKQSLTDKVDI